MPPLLIRLGFLGVLSAGNIAGSLAAAPVHDFGRLPPGGQWVHEFSFTNTLARPLEIEAADKSCSCLEIEAWPHQVDAGKTGTVRVRLHTAGGRGLRSESIRLRLKNADPAELIFGITAFIQAPVEATPEFVSIKPEPGSKTNSFAYVQITNHLTTSVTLTNAVSLTDRFAAKLEAIKPGRSYRLKIEAIPPFNSGNTFGTIQVSTSLPEFPKLEIMALVPSR